mmetsp:Transcript_14049/g.36201  ORF Transcript_14049/g.36201 Transcript_14049/m.36201 type:complete len:739 (+) Transcript_14049:193-2409(+)|eukprot:CAMPEP_0182919864 /NCGR_PEP_ID=MMETSP0105_2-20130417/3045_1 /TAXON_ID=81532 ORGANISM="Acanthoeca-like sp., Strain 10tr" /NCGR_SAMPLE_ID=MMETSP0105_2 /ASSEMBLY_ACC=CAM_ASM_000205 /LENGTH=738 /DNA_ID=CAMNT_0025057145 /DNA_START=182 /DNA_END=2398 /DNA_ORIENTATION=+
MIAVQLLLLAGSATAAKIFFAPGCNTNADNVANYVVGGTQPYSTTVRSISDIPRGLVLQNSQPVDVAFRQGSYALGELELGAGLEVSLHNGGEINLVQGASGNNAIFTAAQTYRPECDAGCHTNYRDGAPTADPTNLPVSTTPICTTDSLVYPPGYGYHLEAYGTLIAAASLSFRNSPVTGSWNPPCSEVNPCASDTVALRSSVGVPANGAFQALFGSSATRCSTTCPTVPPATEDRASLVMPTTDLIQMDMRRVGIHASAPQRLARIAAIRLGTFCRRNPAVACPTTYPTTHHLIVSVTGARPRPDLGALALRSSRDRLSTHISVWMSENFNEIDNVMVADASYGTQTRMQLRLTISYSLGAGVDRAMVEGPLAQAIDELVGNFQVPALSQCTSLPGDVDFLCVEAAVASEMSRVYNGVNNGVQVRTALEQAYSTARGCTVAELGAGQCSARFELTTPLRAAERRYRDAMIDAVILSGTTTAPVVAPPPVQAGAPVLAPTSQAPATHAPVTAAPVTYAPTTLAPTQFDQFGRPQTFAPTSLAPTTVAPTTPAPFTHAPATVNDAAASSSDETEVGGIPLLYLAIVLAVIIIGIAVFVVLKKPKAKEDDVTNDFIRRASLRSTAPNSTAFENPMYDEGITRHNPVVGAVDDDIYDEPQMHIGEDEYDDEYYDDDNVADMYGDQDTVLQDESNADGGGYLDVDGVDGDGDDDDEDDDINIVPPPDEDEDGDDDDDSDDE